MTSLGRRALLGAFASLPLSRAALAAQSGTLAQGTVFETPFHELAGAAAGPTVMVVAGVHGNETAPPTAANQLLSLSLLRGRLVVVPEANRPALAAKTRMTPGSAHPDLNRNFPKDGAPEPRGEMAPHLWKKTLSVAPDWVLDLHEGWGFSASSKSMGSSVVRARSANVDERVVPMSAKVLAAINATVTDQTKRFTMIERGPAGSYARAVVEQAETPAMVFETTWTQSSELRAAQQVRMVRTVLAELGMIPRP